MQNCLRMVSFYQAQLVERPRLANGIMSFLVASSADVTAQMMEGINTPNRIEKGYDINRTRALGLTSGLYMGFLYTTWLLVMHQYFPKANFKSVVIKLTATQCFMQPFIYLPYFFIFHGFLMWQPWNEITRNLTMEFWPVLLRLWALTVPARILMFAVIPIKYQVLYDSLVSFFWQVALSQFDSQNDHPATQGLVSAVMDTERFGHLNARPLGSRYLPQDGMM